MFSGPSRADRALDAFERRTWKSARRLFEQVGKSRRAGGDYHLGLLYWRGLGGPRDAAAAVACFARAAGHGHVAAQTAFGVALRSGVGIAKNEPAAADCFRNAAAAGDSEAMVQLAAMSEPGEARALLRRAADQGHGTAMAALAELVMRADPVKALTWLYVDVALTGDETALKRAHALAREMTGAEIAAAQKSGRARAKSLQTRLKGKQ